jgi:tetratricopeptide (TPR) repeat protein
MRPKRPTARSRASARPINNQVQIAVASGGLGNVYQIRGDLAQAKAMYKRALALNESLGSNEGLASAYGNLGLVYRTRGDLAHAEALHKKSLALDEALGSKAPPLGKTDPLLLMETDPRPAHPV